MHYLTQFSKSLLIGVLPLLISCEGSLRRYFILFCYAPQHIIKRSGQIRHLACILICYFYVTNDHTFNSLNQCMFIISQFPWGSLSMLQGPLQGCNQDVSQGWLLIQTLHWGRVYSQDHLRCWQISYLCGSLVLQRTRDSWKLASSKTAIDFQQDRVLYNVR